MNASYKIKIMENVKSVTCEIAVEHDNKDTAIKEVKELYDDISKYCKTLTLKKNLD